MVDNKENVKKQAVDEFRKYYSGGVLNRIVQNKIIDKYKSLGLSEDELDVIRIKASFEAKGQQYKEPSDDEIYEMQRRLNTRSNISRNSNNEEVKKMSENDNSADSETREEFSKIYKKFLKRKVSVPKFTKFMVDVAKNDKVSPETKELLDTPYTQAMEIWKFNHDDRLKTGREKRAAAKAAQATSTPGPQFGQAQSAPVQSASNQMQSGVQESPIEPDYNEGKDRFPHFFDSMGKNAKGRYLEALILVAAGALVTVLSGGVLVYLGSALIIYAFFILLPNEHQILSKIRSGEFLELREHMGPLFVRVFVKFLFYLLLIIQCFMLNQPVIALLVTFFAYFQMPTTYKTSRPYKAIEAWVRLGFGVLLATEMYAVFAMQNTLMILLTFPVQIPIIFAQLGTVPAASLFFLTAAFFITLPKKIDDQEESPGFKISVTIRNAGKALNAAAGQYQSTLGTAVFLIISFIAGLPIILQWGLWTSFLTVYIVVWIFSIISGWLAGADGRPFIGIVIIIFSLFAFSASFTGVVGQSIFGVWWPQVESFTTSIMEPIGPMFGQLQTGISDSWLMFTDPMGYYNKLQQSTQASTSKVTQGGSVKSIEINSIQLFTSITGQFDPIYESLIGSVEIENKGEFNADNIKLNMWASWTDPKTVSATRTVLPVTTGEFARNINCHSATKNLESYCEWDKTTYPNEVKLVDFSFKSQGEAQGTSPWDVGSGDSLAMCLVKNADGSQKCKSTSDDCCQDDNATYAHGGETVKINVNLTYNYNVNVSLPVEFIDEQRYEDLLKLNELDLKEVTSEYTGGPVKATLWSQRQPIRSGETSMFVASIVNEGNGVINQVGYFTILIPEDIVGDYDNSGGPSEDDIHIVATTFKDGTSEPCKVHMPGDMPLIVAGINYFGLNCVNTGSFGNGEFKRVSFYIKPNDVTVSRTSQIIGLASYEYTKSSSTSVSIPMVPWH